MFFYLFSCIHTHVVHSIECLEFLKGYNRNRKQQLKKLDSMVFYNLDILKLIIFYVFG